MDQQLSAAADRLTDFPERGSPGKVPGTRELSPDERYWLVYKHRLHPGIGANLPAVATGVSSSDIPGFLQHPSPGGLWQLAQGLYVDGHAQKGFQLGVHSAQIKQISVG